ncbi:MAG TPA: nuclear transport factor 2 family protein, partial [Polyangiaceae bacterium]|nr:nuclear transport factor 2 family protein [Polyangiaceae bacterium]
PAPTAKERAAAERYVAALASPGFAQLLPLLDDDAHFAFPGVEEVHGRDAAAREHEALFGAFDERAVVANRVWRTANAQAVDWTMKGVQAREWMGVAATHKSVTFSGLSLLWTKDDGSLADVHVYFDVAVVKAMLGVGPKALLALPVPPFPAASAPHVFEQTGSPDEKKNVAVVAAHLDALEGNREADYVAGVTDDVELNTPEHEPRLGKEAFQAYFKGMHKAVSQLDTTIQNSWGAAQFAIVEYFISGEQIGPIGWIPAQRNKVVRLQTADIAEIRDGKIARVWRYYNPTQIAAASGP